MELKSNNFSSLKYHDIFDYKLTKEELVRWQYKNIRETTKGIKNKGRLQREKYSKDKLKIAKEASKLIGNIPTVKFVGITGSLAMSNASKNDDIDLIIITKVNALWLTRLLVYLLLNTAHYVLRKPNDNNQQDALCLNIWLDETDLVWDKNERSIYTSHEIAQIVPLINKYKTYEKLLWENKWILDYWPNSIEIQKPEPLRIKYCVLCLVLEPIAFWLQYLYMKNKITRETVTATRAIFHPNDWGKVVLSKLTS